MFDLRYSIRQLAKSPGFTAIVVVTLALGVGACTAIFSVAYGVLLRPLDYPDPDRLVAVKETQLPQFPEFSVSPPNFLDWQRQATSFRALAAFSGASLNLTGQTEPQQLRGLKVTAQFFDVFPVRPAIGRTFLPEEDSVGKHRVVMLSHAAWHRVFGGAPDILGRQLELNGESHTVVGVVPPGFGFGSADSADAWVPMAFPPDQTANDNRSMHRLNVAGRLRDGITVEAADSEMKLIAAQLAQQYSESNKGWSTFVMPLLDYMVSDFRRAIYLLLGAVGCVLLIACANIANLLLARATSRQREFSIRAALGATRSRVIGQLLSESLLLAALGGLAGVLVAHWSLRALLAIAPDSLPRAPQIGLDPKLLFVSLALSISTGVLFGLAPAWLAAHSEITDALKQGARGTTDSRGRGRLRSSLVVVQVAFAVTLLGGTGLLVRSFNRLSHVETGLNPENAAILRLTLPEKKYGEPEQQAAFAEALLGRLRALPGVQHAGIAHPFALLQGWTFAFSIEGRPTLPASEMPNATYYAVSPDYFRAAGTRLVRGRIFGEADSAKSPRVAIIGETFARQHFAGEDPIGKRINIGNGPDAWREIVGIVADVTETGIDRKPSSQMYEPFAQNPYRFFNAVVRTTGSPGALLPSLRAAVYDVDKDQPIGSMWPLAQLLNESIAPRRFAMRHEARYYKVICHCGMWLHRH